MPLLPSSSPPPLLGSATYLIPNMMFSPAWTTGKNGSQNNSPIVWWRWSILVETAATSMPSSWSSSSSSSSFSFHVCYYLLPARLRHAVVSGHIAVVQHNVSYDRRWCNHRGRFSADLRSSISQATHWIIIQHKHHALRQVLNYQVI